MQLAQNRHAESVFPFFRDGPSIPDRHVSDRDARGQCNWKEAIE
jgi:hypothetical protein